jgi:hypothetical protein
VSALIAVMPLCEGSASGREKTNEVHAKGRSFGDHENGHGARSNREQNPDGAQKQGGRDGSHHNSDRDEQHLQRQSCVAADRWNLRVEGVHGMARGEGIWAGGPLARRLYTDVRPRRGSSCTWVCSRSGMRKSLSSRWASHASDGDVVALILQVMPSKEGTMLYTILVILIILIVLGFVFGRGRLF